MNRRKKAKDAGTNRRLFAEDGIKDDQISKGYCTTHPKYLSTPPTDYLALMHQAQADYLAAFAGFLAEVEAENG